MRTSDLTSLVEGHFRSREGTRLDLDSFRSVGVCVMSYVRLVFRLRDLATADDRIWSRRTRVRAVAVVLVVLAAGCQSATSPSGDAHGRRPAKNAATAPLLPEDIFAFPSFDFASYQTLLTQLKGTPVVVNIWASWCPPCRREAPLLASAAETHGDAVQFLGVDILDDRTDGRAFIERYGIPYPSLFDASGEIRNQLGFIGIPQTLFYDAQGAIASSWTAPLTTEALRDGLSSVGVPA